jgi:MFS family permease
LNAAHAAEPPAATGQSWDRRLWLVLAILCGAVFLDAMDVSTVNIALPTIGSHLHMSTSSLQWVVSGYVLGYGGFLLLGGRVSDLIGRRRVFVGALAVFAIASTLGGLADSGTVLVATRFIKGLSAAFTVPAGLSLLTTTFTTEADRHRALGAYGATGAAGFSLGLVIGGVLSEIGWRYVFLAPAPVAALIILATLKVIPNAPADVTGKRHYDLPGAFSITASMLLLVYSIVEAPTYGWLTGRTIGGLVASVLLLAAFVAIERRSEEPLVRLGILRVGTLLSTNVATFLFFGSYLGYQFLATFYVQDVAHWSPIATALAFLPTGAFLPVLGAQAPRLIGRFGTTRLIGAGLLLFTAGYALFLNLDSAHLTYATMLLPTIVLLGLGWGVAFPAMNVQATAGVEDHEQGLAAGLFSTAAQTGGALLIAVVSAVLSSHVASHGGHVAAGVVASITPVVTILIPAALVGFAALLALLRIRPATAKASDDQIELALAEEAAAL